MLYINFYSILSIKNKFLIYKYSNKFNKNCSYNLPSSKLPSKTLTSSRNMSITETQSHNNQDWHQITGKNTSKNPESRSRGCRDFFRQEGETEKEKVWTFSLAEGRFAYRVRTARSRNSWAVGAHFCTVPQRGGWRRSPSLRHPPAVSVWSPPPLGKESQLYNETR